MPRPIWTGAISFGLVNVPVKLTTATSTKDVRFHQLDGSDGTRIQQKRVRPDSGEEVPYERIVKGYEIGPDRFVIIEPDELSSLDPKASRTIDIEEFVELDEIDPLFFEKGYYLVPDKAASKPYMLLVKALEETGKVAIARFVMRTKEYLCAIRSREGALVLSTLLYGDEVVPVTDLDALPDADEVTITEREVKMATQLVESLTADWDPMRYHDEYREKVLAMIEAKAEGQEIVAGAPADEPTKVVDLMAALEASLEAARAERSKREDTEDTAASASA